ncbi:MAG TPA: OmpA family protein [Labilithrix sp.]|nr:OmpA family protein [Labilithrix sp.]
MGSHPPVRRVPKLRRKLASGALVVSALLAGRGAFAQSAGKGFTLDRFDPSERGSEWFSLDSLDLRGHLRPAAGVVGTWAYNPLTIYDQHGRYHSSLVHHQVFEHPGASLVLWNRLRGAISLPIAVYQTGDPIVIGTKSYAPPASAVGDLRLSADVRLYGEHGSKFTSALGVAVHLPTGEREHYTSDGQVRVHPRASIAGDIGTFTYSARLGVHYRGLDEQFVGRSLGSELTGGVATGVRVANRRLVFGPEVHGSSLLDSSFLARRSTPIEWLVGLHYTFPHFRVGGGVGTGLARGWGTPSVRAFLSAEWTPGFDDDPDKDGVPTAEDACPKIAGVRTLDPKTNGCRAPAEVETEPDRDGDGVADSTDACPNVVGVATDNPKTNGCPRDRDGDGVPDRADACPDTAGVKSEDPKQNGCPPDSDGDGVADVLDSCPDVPGDKSDDPMQNGCPADRDGDGVADKEDPCPDAPGPADSDPKRNGCPLARIEDGQIKIVEQVKFKSGSAEILRESDATLLAVATTLMDHPEITKVRVEGHTDNQGKPDANERLSQKRAEAVVSWLTSYGFDKKRFEAKGLGMRQPLDTNNTEEGRNANRRVEFHITARTEPKTPEPSPAQTPPR